MEHINWIGIALGVGAIILILRWTVAPKPERGPSKVVETRDGADIPF